MTDQTIDLRIDLTTEDKTGLPMGLPRRRWRSRIVPGRYLIVGAGDAVAVTQIVDVAVDGLVHVRPVRGTVEANRHLLDVDPTHL